VEQAVLDVSAVVGEREACQQFGVPRASFQRHQVSASVEREIALLDQNQIAIAVQDPDSKLSRPVRRYLARKAEVSKRTRVSMRALTLPLGGQSKPTGQGQLKTDQWSVGTFKTGQ
jgi:hypothetical protein